MLIFLSHAFYAESSCVVFLPPAAFECGLLGKLASSNALKWIFLQTLKKYLLIAAWLNPLNSRKVSFFAAKNFYSEKMSKNNIFYCTWCKFIITTSHRRFLSVFSFKDAKKPKCNFLLRRKLLCVLFMKKKCLKIFCDSS